MNARKKTLFAIGIWLVLLALLAGWPAPASAVVVDPLPPGNLIANPWFHEPGNLDLKGNSGWVDVTGNWSYSQKVSNPGLVESGTAARLADTLSAEVKGQVVSHGGEVGTIYTVVSADPSARLLKFKTHYVSLNIVRAEANVYSGPTEEGPWTQVWTPFLLTPENETRLYWQEMEMIQTSLDSGHPFYKIEFSAEYQANFSWGFKFTGVYFSVESQPQAANRSGFYTGPLTPGGRQPFNGYVGFR